MINMEVVREDIDKLNALLKVKVVPADYKSKVETKLENHRKQANIPGFRKGFVPMSLTNNMEPLSYLMRFLKWFQKQLINT